jgi:hypothetical protein
MIQSPPHSPFLSTAELGTKTAIYEFWRTFCIQTKFFGVWLAVWVPVLNWGSKLFVWLSFLLRGTSLVIVGVRMDKMKKKLDRDKFPSSECK